MSNRFWKAMVFTVSVIVVSEATLTIAAFVANTYRRSVPTDIAAQRLLLSRWFLSPFLSVDVRIKPYIGGRQHYVGDLISDSANSLKLFPPDALLGWRLGQNVTAVVGDGPNSFVFVTNDEEFASHGERDFHYGLSHSGQRYRIIIVGGSTVLGWGSGTPNQNLPAYVDRSLGRDRSNGYKIINAGVSGYNSRQEFLYIASELVQYRPDLLIVSDGWNDESAAEQDSPIPNERINLFKTPRHLLMESPLTASYSVLGSLQLFVGNVKARIRTAMHHTGIYWLVTRLTPHIIQKPELNYNPARVQMYESNLVNVLNLAGRKGIRVALFLQPIMWIDGRTPTLDETRRAAPDLHSARQAFYEQARHLFDRLKEQHQRPGQVCIEDLSQALKDTATTIYHDSGHLLGAGNKIVADEIVKKLANCGVLAK
jgi:lysophospholipase L1-like esterase